MNTDTIASPRTFVKPQAAEISGSVGSLKRANRVRIRRVAAARSPREKNYYRREFESLCQLSPQLKDFYEEVLATRDDRTAPYFCPNRLWNRELRDRLEDLVGWHAPENLDSRLRTQSAWEISRHFCFDALPDCRGCACIVIDAIIAARAASTDTLFRFKGNHK